MGKIRRTDWLCTLLLLLLAFMFIAGIPIGYGTSSQTASLETISTIKLNGLPYSIAVNEETNRIYAGTNYEVIVFNGTQGTITTRYGVIVIDGTTKQILTTISVNSTPYQIVVDAVNNKIFARSNYANITVIDGATNSILGELPLTYTGEATDIAVDSERNLVYVGISEDLYQNVNDRIQIYNENTLDFIDSIPIPGSASRSYHSVYVGLNTRLNRIYATWSGNNTIFMFDGTTRNLLKTGQYTSPTKTIWRVDPNTNRIYLKNETLDGDTLQVKSSFNLGNVFGRPVFDPYYNIVYAVRGILNNISDPMQYELAISDISNNDVFATLSLADALSSRIPDVAANTKTGEIYLTPTNYITNEIIVVKGISPSSHILATDLLVNPQQVEIGHSVNVSFRARNLANISETYVPRVRVGTLDLTLEQVQLASREGRTFQFTVNMSSIGNYTVTAEGLSSYLLVQDTTPPSLPAPDDGISGWSNNSTPRFMWSASMDNGSGVAGYYYKVDSGPETWTTSTNVTLSTQTDGSHTFYVKAKDNAGNNGTYGSHAFQIDRTPPAATIAYPSNGTTLTSASLSFGASSSTDISGIAGYIWDFGDGATSSGTTATHTYTLSGTFAAKLTVTDGAGNKATSTITLTVPENVVPEFSPFTFLVLGVFGTLIVLVAKTNTKIKLKKQY